ncbi:DUF2905 family protein [Tindallia californiensis]
MISLGTLFLLVGFFLLLMDRIGLDSLPGNFLFQKGRVTFFFPLTASIIISLLLTFVFNILLRK